MHSEPSVPLSTNESQITPRVATRMPVHSIVQSRMAGSSARFAVELRDLSCTGLRCFCGTQLSPNQILFLTIPGLATMEMKVVWVKGSEYGCVFTYPLHNAVFDYIIDHFRTDYDR